MKWKAIAAVCILACAAVLNLSGCSGNTASKIGNTTGQVLDIEGKPGVEGMVTKLTGEEIAVRVVGEEWNFKLSDTAKKELSYFNEDENNPKIAEGVMINLFYEEIDGVKYAKNFEVVLSN